MFSQVTHGSTWPAHRPEKYTRCNARWLRSLAVAAFVLALVAPISASADWPERQVKLVVTFPPGSANDAAARIFADALGKKWGKAVVVEDRYSAVFKLDRVRPVVIAEGLGEAAAGFGSVPIVFAETRPPAQE